MSTEQAMMLIKSITVDVVSGISGLGCEAGMPNPDGGPRFRGPAGG